MIRSCPTSGWLRAAVPAAVASANLMCPQTAQAQDAGHFSVDGSLAAGYSSSPFLSTAGNEGNGSIYGQLTLSPTYVLREATATSSLGGTYQQTRYLRGYGNSSSYSAYMQHQRRIDAYTNLNLAVRYGSSIVGEQRAPGQIAVPPVTTPDTPTQPDAPLPGTDLPSAPGQQTPQTPTDLIDPELIGQRERMSSVGVSANMSTQLNEYGTLAASLGASRTYYKSSAGADYRQFDGNGSYSRRLGDGSSAGVQVNISRVDYQREGRDATTVRPQLTYNRQFGPTLSLNAALGAMFIKEADGTTNGISGNVGLCYRADVDSMCLSVSRDAGPSGVGAVTKQLGGSLGYNRQLGQFDVLSLSISYSRSSALANERSPFLTPRNATSYFDTTVTWSTQLGQNVSAGTSFSVRKVWESSSYSSRDFNGQVYIRANLEALR